jgi:DnaJ-class molecular chaperone
MGTDHYDALGVGADADQATLRTAYLAIMRASHPDLRPRDAAAAERARLANSAWHVLGDPSRRAAYDRTRQRLRTGSTDHLATDAHVEALRQAAVARRAHRDAREQIRRTLGAAILKVGAAILLIGLVLLLSLSAR